VNDDDEEGQGLEFPLTGVLPDTGEPGNVRFNVTRNGQRFCVAGIAGHGLVAMHLAAVTRHPDLVRELQMDGKRFEDRLGMSLRGLDDNQPENRSTLIWIAGQPLCIGDEVLVQLLPPGECDPPERLPSVTRID
jgi:hypothetical protein